MTPSKRWRHKSITKNPGIAWLFCFWGGGRLLKAVAVTGLLRLASSEAPKTVVHRPGLQVTGQRPDPIA
jgi:hypothetical protein